MARACIGRRRSMPKVRAMAPRSFPGSRGSSADPTSTAASSTSNRLSSMPATDSSARRLRFKREGVAGGSARFRRGRGAHGRRRACLGTRGASTCVYPPAACSPPRPGASPPNRLSTPLPAAAARTEPAANPLARWLAFPGIPLGLIALLLAFILFPPVRGQQGLVLSFLGAGAVLLAWTILLWAKRGRSQAFGIDLYLVRAHWIQGLVQSSLYAYWGWYWRAVYHEVPLVVAQLVFLYAFDALLNWSRGRRWRLGLGQLPIILSTNVFIWFKDDWFAFQFLMVATAALGKEFIKWERGGRRTHIFNPSALALMVFSVVLILTGTTEVTWAGEIASSFAKPPHIYAFIFTLG